jgi:hypothetical protein
VGVPETTAPTKTNPNYNTSDRPNYSVIRPER